MKRARKEGLKNIWVSNGFMTKETFKAISPYLDAINIDIKSFSDEFYRQNCGARLEPVLESCWRVVKKKIHLEITTLVIPTLSDDEKNLKELAKFIKRELGADVPWHVSAFSGEISWKLQHLPSTPLTKLKKIRQIGRDIGLNYVYVGNVYNSGLDNTFCPKCSKEVIKRLGYNVKNRLLKGLCRKCGQRILSKKQI